MCGFMVLFVTIPAYNEAETIGTVIQSVPRSINGVDEVYVLVSDDGSEDDTAQAAREAGADYVLHRRRNKGLAETFRELSEEAYRLGGDIMVNTDADNQYDQREIPRLVTPILEENADLVLGDRQVPSLVHMPRSKQIGNQLGSATVRSLSGLSVTDASTGFRAYSRDFLWALHLFSEHTYTHETLIFAANYRFRVTEVPVTFRPRASGDSRLIGNVVSHIQRSGVVIVRSILMYKAYRLLVWIGALLCLGGLLLGVRYLVFFLSGDLGAEGHVQSLILATILISVGFSTVITGVLADLIKVNRLLLERLVREQRQRNSFR